MLIGIPIGLLIGYWVGKMTQGRIPGVVAGIVGWVVIVVGMRTLSEISGVYEPNRMPPGVVTSVGYVFGLLWGLRLGKRKKSPDDSKPVGAASNISKLDLEELYDLRSEAPSSAEDAASWYLARALRADAYAQYNMGVIHLHGWGVRANRREAARWFLASSKTRETDAQDALQAIKNTFGVRPDKEPRLLIERQEIQDKPLGAAQENLEWVYEIDGAPEEPRAQFRFYSKRANEGDLDAIYNVGIMLVNGSGVRRSLADAFEWFEKAARNGHQESQFVCGCIKSLSSDNRDFSVAFA